MLNFQNTDRTMSKKQQNSIFFHKDQGNYEKINDQQLKQVYLCSCGKQYQSFPATYLHFRTKHNIKLSTKPTEKRRSVIMEGNVRKITYQAQFQGQKERKNSNQKSSDDIRQQQQKQRLQESYHNEVMSQQMKKIKSCIQEYLNNSNTQQEILYKNMLKYAKQYQKSQIISEKGVSIDKILYLFNSFTMQYLPQNNNSIKIGSQQWQRLCLELKKFSDWLHLKRYTNLILLCNN